MVTSEREMLQQDEIASPPAVEKFTSLQPTYEDSVAPETGWELEDTYDQR